MFVENRGSDGTGRRPAVLVEASIRRSRRQPDLRGRFAATCLGCAEVQPRHFTSLCRNSRSAVGLLLVIDIGQRKAACVLHDVAGGAVPRRPMTGAIGAVSPRLRSPDQQPALRFNGGDGESSPRLSMPPFRLAAGCGGRCARYTGVQISFASQHCNATAVVTTATVTASGRLWATRENEG